MGMKRAGNLIEGLSDKLQCPPVTMSYLNEGCSLKEGRNGHESLQQRERETVEEIQSVSELRVKTS